MTKLEYAFYEKTTLHEMLENIGKLTEEENPERGEMYSAIICNLATSIETLHHCIDEVEW